MTAGIGAPLRSYDRTPGGALTHLMATVPAGLIASYVQIYNSSGVGQASPFGLTHITSWSVVAQHALAYAGAAARAEVLVVRSPAIIKSAFVSSFLWVIVSRRRQNPPGAP
jgi:hypothetical protein